MNIQKASTELSQQRVQEQAAVMMESKALSGFKEQAEGLMKVLDSAGQITDPALGNRVNYLA
ncbi:MAG: YjfB family protein [Treponema sp.]|nr:YjfB family protein [Treponema sp.]